MIPPVSPPRLANTEGPVGKLCRDAAVEYRMGLDAEQAWRQQRARAGSLPRRFVLVPSLAFCAAAAASLLVGHFRDPAPNLGAQVEPEARSVLRRGEAKTAPPASPTSIAPKAPTEAPRKRPSVLGTGDAPRALAVAPPNTLAPLAQPLAEDSTAKATTEPALDCLSFARAGDATRSESCFEAQSKSGSLAAEVALYELARLRRDMLGRPLAALSALDEYLRRFPGGSLSLEVRFSRLELLVKMGRASEVLQASDELLALPSGQERAAEVHFLRGNVYAHSLASPAEAAREYALASSSPGRVGDEAAFLTGISFEKAGDTEQARAAFDRYLKRSSAQHLAEAKAHLNALSSPAAGEGH